MSIIMPAGEKEVKWSPVIKDDPMTKTASSEEQDIQEPQDDKDILWEVAKKVVEEREAKEAQTEEKVVKAAEETEEKCVGAEEEKEACGDVVAEEGEDGDESPFKDGDEAPCEEGEGDAIEDVVEDAASPVEDIQEAVAELAEKAEQAEEAVEKADAALDQVSAVIEEVKSELGGESVEESVEVEVEDDAPIDDMVEVEVEEIPGEPIVEDSDMIVEGDGIFASTDGFTKLSKLSPENRNKLNSYWKGFYSDASDWVNLLTKDYEK